MSERLFPYTRWNADLPALAAAYGGREPYPHIHLLDFLDQSVVEQMVHEFTESPPGGWVQYKHFNENKSGLTARARFPPLIGRVVDELNSAPFVAWLSQLTGIPDLLPDPSLEGGGLHQSERGGFLNVHADFTRHHHQKSWRRRVNVIVYLNPAWQLEWGGAIELWDKGMTRRVVSVPPLANHALIFNTDEFAYHGFPDPITCPAGVTRKSLALYYYTADEAGAVARSTNYRARPEDTTWRSALIWADKQAVHVYSRVKSTLGLSDDIASRALNLLDRAKTPKPIIQRRQEPQLVEWRAFTGRSAWTRRAVRWLEPAFWFIAIVLGAAQAWVSRFQPSTIDAVSYLDIGDAYTHGHWHEAVNGYWNPLYSWILGLVLEAIPHSARLEFPVAKLVDFAIYLLALASFSWFLKGARRTCTSTPDRETGQSARIPEWAWIVAGYTLFLWTSLRWITLTSSTPDMCGTAIAYCAWGLLFRLDGERRFQYPLLGGILACGYLARTPMFLVGCVMLAMAAFYGATPRRRRGLIVAATVFVAITAPFIAAISHLRGHLTIGDNAKLNHAWLVNPGSLIIPNRHWQGGPPGYGVPKHPSRMLWDTPPAFEFALPGGGTYAPWTDPSYWYDGLSYHFDGHAEWVSLADNARFYYELFGRWLLLAFAVVVVCAGDAGATVRAVGRSALYWGPAALGLALYLVAAKLGWQSAQPSARYVAAFVVVLCVTVTASLRFRSIPSVPVQRVATVGLLLITSCTIGRLVHDRAHAMRQPVPTAPWSVAEALHQSGVGPGMRVATIGSPARHAFWARLARVRIVAEVPSDTSFWAKSPALQDGILEALGHAGAQVVVAAVVPESAHTRGWRSAGVDGYGVFWPGAETHLQSTSSTTPEGLSRVRVQRRDDPGHDPVRGGRPRTDRARLASHRWPTA